MAMVCFFTSLELTEVFKSKFDSISGFSVLQFSDRPACNTLLKGREHLDILQDEVFWPVRVVIGQVGTVQAGLDEGNPFPWASHVSRPNVQNSTTKR